MCGCAGVRVCGAGVADTMAAVAAARAGAKVLLLERYGFLGGNATAGAVAQFNSWQTANGRRIVQVRALTKSGIVAIRPQVLIDNSGDMDALRKAGASFLSLDEHESLPPATMMFRFGPIDFVALESADIGALARAALHVARDPFSQNGWFNVSRLAIDATDAMALGRAEIEGRQQAWNAAKFLRHSVPGCADGRLQAFGTQVGIRETRCAGRPCAERRRAAGAGGLRRRHRRRRVPHRQTPSRGGEREYSALGDDHAYQIPYRSLCPVGLDNVLVAGRGISASHKALAAIRVMTTSMAVGQAAGMAAARVAAKGPGASTREVSVARLRASLLDAGACLASSRGSTSYGAGRHTPSSSPKRLGLGWLRF